MMACSGCLEGCTNVFEPLAEQPHSSELTIDGAFIKTLVLPNIGMIVPQHAHASAHLTIVVRGSVRVWVNNLLLGMYRAPASLLIGAGDMHHFEVIRPDTLLRCVHGAPVEVIAENSVPGVG